MENQHKTRYAEYCLLLRGVKAERTNAMLLDKPLEKKLDGFFIQKTMVSFVPKSEAVAISAKKDILALVNLLESNPALRITLEEDETGGEPIGSNFENTNHLVAMQKTGGNACGGRLSTCEGFPGHAKGIFRPFPEKFVSK